MNALQKRRFYSLIILSCILFLMNEGSLFKLFYYYESKDHLLYDDNEISFIVNFKEITKSKHYFFYEIIKNLSTNRNYYFIKTIGNNLNENITKIVENTSVKIVQSNFPDTIFLPLIISLYGITTPKYVFFIEGEDLTLENKDNLITWFINTYNKIKKNNYDYIFGGSQFIEDKKIGCSLLLSKSSIIEHLLYYTDSDTSHANPLIQLSLATKTKFCFDEYNYLQPSKLENFNQIFSSNMQCPSINDKNIPSLCIILPNFKRNYLIYSFSAFAKQTFKPKFYIVIQNDNIIHYNISLIRKIVNEPIYHIWMQNWFFFLFKP